MTARDPSGPVEWRWVDIGGEQHKVRFDEIAKALTRGRLPPHVLVWRTGWAEWVPAANVPELRQALGPGQSGPPSVQTLNPASVAPPPPPPAHYAATVPRGTLTLERPGMSSVPPPAPGRPSVARRVSPPARSVSAASIPVPIRDVMPTLADQEPTKSTTLRPMGALPPPPRAVPPPKRPPFSSIPPVEPRPLVPPLAGPPRTPIPPEPATEPLSDEPRDVDTIVPPPRTSADVPEPQKRDLDEPSDARSTPAGAFPAPTRREASTPAFDSDPPRPPEPGAGGLSRKTIATLTSAGVLIPGVVLLAFALLHPKHAAKAPVVEVASSAPAPSPPPKPPPGCTIEKSAQRLSEAANMAVPVLMATVPHADRAAVGFAASKDHALGITVDAALAVTATFEETVTGSTTLGVVPLVRAGRLEFAVDRADPELSSARTIDAPKRFSIGLSHDGISRVLGAETDVIWPTDAKGGAITTPRVASMPGTGHAVVFRQGGQDGKVLTGWLHEDGTKLTDLRPVSTQATLAGTPTISASDRGVLVAFAAKTTAADPWHIELATAAAGALPEHTEGFEVPKGGPGGEAISPVSEGLSDGRFLLQWTEGSAGNRAVRAQELTQELVAMGDPVTLSSSDQNSGQGALWVQGNQALALYLVQKDAAHELWGASLKCQ